ncbi:MULTISPECIES: helix-turn-helix domain-containing protein [Niallia]|uniref:AraC family transcriptional regulator n=1 Tax=Niallia alba TaxID=2729105 RepID=A0A7Y0K661_9BACI|nr:MULTISPECIES: helix-turn-helix domain-containing protein [Niallia]NMO76514.1 AraC family transcriptional regulator [Niallia alba]UTI44231.1 AraC family transcriptional regulator [Niallia sp. RD1]
MVFFEDHGVEEKESFEKFTLINDGFPLHFHRAYELIIVNEGELFVRVDQKEYLLQKNDVAFIFPNQLHEFKTIHHSHISVVIFSPELIGHFFMNYKGFVPENNVIHLHNTPILQTLHSIYQQKSFLYDICGKLVENTSLTPVEYSTKMKVFHKILLYVDQHYSYDCTLKTVAKHLQYDYAYLSKLFVHITNRTFTEYLTHYRISQACYQLKNSQQPIGEIALNCGYNNLRSFHRNFKKVTNISPKKYRELA